MSDWLEAAEGALALVCGGFIFLLFGSALETTGLIDLTLWGVIYVVVGVLIIITLVASITGAFISEVL